MHLRALVRAYAKNGVRSGPMTDPNQLAAEQAALQERIERLRAESPRRRGTVVTVFATKGGVGKSSLSIELAWALDAVLVDLDWDGGGSSVALGYRAEAYLRKAPLLDALESGRPPSLWTQSNRPHLVPAHPDFEANQPEPAEMTQVLMRWAKELDRCLVVDCHPGTGAASSGAIGAADLVVVPVVLKTRELDAVERQLNDYAGHETLLVPNLVPERTVRSTEERLEKIAAHSQVPVGPIVSEYAWYPHRKIRTAVCALPRPSLRAARMAAEYADVAEEVARRVNTD